jgi:hypothetical protein
VTEELIAYDALSALARADQVAQAQVLADYRQGKAANTLARQCDDIALFETYLAEAGVVVSDMAENLALWAHVSQGLIRGFVRWQLQRGYTVGTVNVRLSTVKTYARLATSAGYLPTERYQLISTVRTISGKEGRNINERREVSRVGHKKAGPVAISPAHVALIKQKLRVLAMQGDQLGLQMQTLNWSFFQQLSW